MKEVIIDPNWEEQEAQQQAERERLEAASRAARRGGDVPWEDAPPSWEEQPAPPAEPEPKPAKEPLRAEGELRAELVAEGVEDAAAEPEEDVVVPRAVKEYFKAFISGGILSSNQAIKLYPYMILAAALAVAYIGNILQMQKMYDYQVKLSNQVKELRTKSLTYTAIRNEATRRSSIEARIDARGLGLKKSPAPPKPIE